MGECAPFSQGCSRGTVDGLPHERPPSRQRRLRTFNLASPLPVALDSTLRRYNGKSGQHSTMTKHFGYYDDWKSTILECPRCGWKGTFDQGSVEHHDALMDSSCPQCAWLEAHMLAIVSYPTIQEAEQNWSRLDEGERRHVVAIRQRQEQWEKASLKVPDQLPELEGADLSIVWDCVDEAARTFTVLRHGDVEIWREPAVYEGYERFRAIVLILRQKYGVRLADVVPTPASKSYLYGDKLSAPDHVRETVSSLKQDRRGVSRTSTIRKSRSSGRQSKKRR